MRWVLTPATVAVAVSLGASCKFIDRIPDEQFAALIEDSTEAAASLSLGAVLADKPQLRAEVQEAARIARQAIDTVIVPLLDGAPTAQLIKAAIGHVMQELDQQLSQEIKSVVTLVVSAVARFIPLPDLPDEAIDIRTRLALKGFFRGLLQGVDRALMGGPPVVPALAWPDDGGTP